MVLRVRRTRVRRAATLAAGLLLVPALMGCGADVERDQAVATADRFAADVAHDPQGACALLAPRTVQALEQGGSPCATALPSEDLPPPGEPTSVSVAGHSAQVRYTSEAVFLSLFDVGWRVTAAGCTRTSADPAVPYECTVEG